jgi:hypothetical protein
VHMRRSDCTASLMVIENGHGSFYFQSIIYFNHPRSILAHFNLFVLKMNHRNIFHRHFVPIE